MGTLSSSAPASVAVLKSFKGPTDKARSWRFPGRERIAAIAGTSSSTVPTVTSFQVNPGLSGTFPWLSGESDKWDQYCFRKLIFEWIPASGSSGTGFAAISPDYDASDPAPTTTAQISNTEDSVVQRVWEHFVCPLSYNSMHALGPRKFTRNGNVAGDLKTFDVAKLSVATWGQGNTNLAGELWANYEVELFVPQNSESGAPSSVGTMIRTNTAGQTFATGVAEAFDFETLVVDPLGIGAPSVGVFTLPAGAYLISVQVTAIDTSDEIFTVLLEIQKNNTALSPAALAQTTRDGDTTNQYASVSIYGYVTSSGSDTFRIMGTMIGAAGTLGTVAFSCQLVVRVA